MTCIYLAESAQTSANELAHTFDLTIACQLPDSGEYLYADSDGISLCRAGEKGRVQVDFVGGAAQYRRTKGGGELIAKAVNHTNKPTIWDGTGGLGRDSFVLASLGLTVQTFEQHPAVACLLHDGLNRALQHPDTAEIARRITLHFGDTATLMPQLAQQIGRPDVVYLDPMYPERQKSAAVKKEMAYFHGLVGTAQDEAALLNTARTIAKKRVVVKRPRLGEFLNGEKPAYQYSGKSTRFDAYVPNSPTQE
ncbi:class I SAM-dependent methyltransferase [Neisseria sp. CCUG17229]|uniref:class I SAM-dependent methyltransferase n=1 Tax=Neisseria sp. CCUG17229 TaxID=3392036 RepID=UPI003A101888